MSTFQNLVNEVTIDQIKCVICGLEHESNDCSYVKIQHHVPDTKIPPRARLTLPDFLEIKKLVDDTFSVTTRECIKKGTLFGPLQAQKVSTLNPAVTFPLKLFATKKNAQNGTEDGGSGNEEKSAPEFYLDTVDENECNWLIFISPAACYEEQNLVCYQEFNAIYYASIKDIPIGETLRVWYSPYYANRMNKDIFTTAIAPDVKKMDVNALIKRHQKILERESWTCKFCRKVETEITVFAKHMLDHYINRLERKCEICQDQFQSMIRLKTHMKLKHSSTSITPVRVANNETNKTDSLEKNELNEPVLGGPLLLNDIITDSLDNSNNQFGIINNLNNNSNMIIEPENLNIDNLITENVKELDHFNFEIDESGSEKFICDICIKEFSKLKNLVQHIRQHTGEFICQNCQMVFSRKENLTSHSCKAGKSVKCEYCGKLFAQHKYLRRHIKTHETSYFCKHCNKNYVNETELNVHNCPSRPDEEKTKYVCNTCNKVFYREKYLKTHVKRHMQKGEEKNRQLLICDLCGQSFIDSGSYYSHKKKHEKNIKCDFCDKMFYRKTMLKEHIATVHKITDGPELPMVECDICNKKLKSNRVLQTHKKISHGPKERIQCTECNGTFTTKFNLQKHIRSIHKAVTSQYGEGYSCPFCDRCCKLKRSIVKHIKTLHADQAVNFDPNTLKSTIIFLQQRTSRAVNNETKNKILKNITNDNNSNSSVIISNNNNNSNVYDNMGGSSASNILSTDDNNDTSSNNISDIDMNLSDLPNMVVTSNNNNNTSEDTLNEFNLLTNGENNDGDDDDDYHEMVPAAPPAEKTTTVSNMLYDSDMEFEAILNEPNSDVTERYSSFEEIELNLKAKEPVHIENREVCLSIPDLSGDQEITLGNNAYLLENGTIIEPQENPANVVVYILDQKFT